MSPIKIGILSDTHISQVSPVFLEKIEACFAETRIIMHAGDLTELSILNSFDGHTVHAVHGNMCGMAAQLGLPRKKTIELGGFKIGLIHHAGYSYDFEDQLPDEFDQVDCIVYGHTHLPVCHLSNGVLFINPGSFMAIGRYGAPGTYAILDVGKELSAKIYEAPNLG